MAADTTHAPVLCPDPSVHDKSHKASEHASSAAVLATQTGRSSTPKSDVLDSNGHLTSRGAATSLKHAKPQDLPSFPSRGGVDSSAAGTAAMVGWDHKMKELWHPEMSNAGSKAALLAHKSGGSLDLWHPSGSRDGNSAATIAMRNKTLSPQIDRGFTDVGRNNSLAAATMSDRRSRQRAGSMPTSTQPGSYPDASNSTKNALNAATVSHRTSTKMAPDGWNSEANQAARIQHGHMDRQLFTEHPLVQPEIDERKHLAAQRASAVSMARSMYEYQNRASIPSDYNSAVGSAGAETAHRRNQSSTSTPDIKEEAMKYIHLQDAAHKMAQERLAKVDKELEQGRYREYYGYSPKKSRMSLRGRNRRRASSEGEHFDDSSDEEQARRIRSRTAQLSSSLKATEDKQRQVDRAKVMAAAEKRVHARMHDMDEKVFLDTGKPTQAMMDEWETKAREKAEQNRTQREQNPGKTHIGGGKYMDSAEIEAIAAARLKPTLDEINDTAEKKRERDAEILREKDLRETAAMEEKIKDREQKAEFKRIRDQDKAAAKREKEERKARERAEKEEAKARKSEDKRKSREQAREAVTAVAGGATLAEVADHTKQEPEATREVPEESKQKTGGRGMLSRIFRKRGDEEKRMEEPERATDSAEEARHVVERPDQGAAAGGATTTPPAVAAAGGSEEEHVIDEDASARAVDDHPDHGAEVPAMATTSTDIAAAGGIEREHAPGAYPESVEESPRSPKSGAAALVGFGALGAGIAAGVAANRASREHARDVESDVSSLSSGERGGLAAVAPTISAEHTGDYKFATPSPPEERRRPDLERHISTIQSSSDDESDDLYDSDNDSLTNAEPSAVADQAPIAEDIEYTAPAVQSPAVDTAPSASRQVTDQPDSPVSPLSPSPAEDNGKIVILNKQASPEDPHLVVAPRPSTSESGAPAPVVKPRAVNEQQAGESEQESKGIKGFFSKLKGGRSKPQNKLVKKKLQGSSGASSIKSEKSFQGGAKYTGASEKDDAITPVTTTTAGLAAEGNLPTQDVNREEAIRDAQRTVDVGANARAESPSSFQRYDDQLKDLDDVSSSGAEEEDLATSRRGRLAQRFGLSTEKPQTAALEVPEARQTSVSNGDEDQFEEARDHFDAPAPQPAFAGQAKSESPARGTRFQEQF